MFSSHAAFRDPVTRACLLMIFFFGFSSAATAPYKSVIGIRELGLANTQYAALILLAAPVSICIGLCLGGLADRIGSYRRLMLGATLSGIAGYSGIFWFPSKASFALALLVFLPIYNGLNALLFAKVRSADRRLGGREAGTLTSTARAVISLSWVLVPGIVAFSLAGRQSMLPSYFFASAAAATCALLTIFVLPDDRPDGGPGSRSSEDRPLLGAARRRTLVLRILGTGMIGSMVHASDQTLPLILTGQAEGRMTDIGIVVGIIAFLEVGLIFAWARVQSRIGSLGALTGGVVVYASYLTALSFASQPWHVYALALPAAIGAAALVSVPITYLQDLLPERPGLGSSLIIVNFFLGAGICACIFALGARMAGYSGSVRFAAVTGGMGLALLFLSGERIARPSRGGL